MKPYWDQLMEEYKSSETSLIADVDCTAGGKTLCTKHNVEGYPTIKYGDPEDLQNYEGGRELADLEEFARENLGPVCSVEKKDLCSEEEIKMMEKYMKYKGYDLEDMVEKKENLIKNIEDKFAKTKEDIEAKIKAAMKVRDKKIKKTKNKAYSMMKLVNAYKKNIEAKTDGTESDDGDADEDAVKPADAGNEEDDGSKGEL